jgi:hypothetical protein
MYLQLEKGAKKKEKAAGKAEKKAKKQAKKEVPKTEKACKEKKGTWKDNKCIVRHACRCVGADCGCDAAAARLSCQFRVNECSPEWYAEHHAATSGRENELSSTAACSGTALQRDCNVAETRARRPWKPWSQLRVVVWAPDSARVYARIGAVIVRGPDVRA